MKVNATFLPALLPVMGLYALAILSQGCQAHADKGARDKSTRMIAAVSPVSTTRPGSAIVYDRSKRYIFLTFDDAPQLPGTTNCKNVFLSQGIKATFFLVGLHTEMSRPNKEMLDSLRNDYPSLLIANHSYSHGFRNHYHSFYSRPDSAVKDVLRAQSILQAPVRIVRLPGNNAWVGIGENQGSPATRNIRYKLDSLGYTVIGWDVEWSWGGKKKPYPRESADEMVREVNSLFARERTHEPNTIVILSHDRLFAQPQYADSLAKFISILKRDPRNVFETIDHYPLVQRQTGISDSRDIAYSPAARQLAKIP